ncbi:MAG TPA: hypothetical protein VLI39_10130 [Sedimentisphaerales bacterium]|nr:hypothetical protein [Sedimentisphaerales bacterium]
MKRRCALCRQNPRRTKCVSGEDIQDDSGIARIDNDRVRFSPKCRS